MPVTTILSAITIVMYYAGFGSDRCDTPCPLNWNKNNLTTFLLHPFIHYNPVHLYGNIFGLVIVGYLIEQWPVLWSPKKRYTIFPIAYGISYFINLLVWESPIKMKTLSATLQVIQQTGEPWIGASVVVFALSAFPLRYYFWFHKEAQVKGQKDIWAPILIGIALSPLLTGILLLGIGYGGLEVIFHLTGFVIGYFIAGGFFRRMSPL